MDPDDASAPSFLVAIHQDMKNGIGCNQDVEVAPDSDPEIGVFGFTFEQVVADHGFDNPGARAREKIAWYVRSHSAFEAAATRTSA